MADLKVTLKRSLIGRPKNQEKIIQSLGLDKKINSSVVLNDTDAVRKTIKRVAHLVEVEEQAE